MKEQGLDYKHETIRLVEQMQNDYYIKMICGFVTAVCMNIGEYTQDEEH